MSSDICVWENEGGAAIASPQPPSPLLIGTESQIEWAGRIRRLVNDEFDRVARSFVTVASKQDAVKRVRTEAILAILEDIRRAVMSRTEAGYFIRDWQDISDQVRQMIGNDPRYQALTAASSRRRD
jgi:hypothetical protein